MGEKAIQKIGLAAPSNDANTGDIEQPWSSFVHMRDGLKEIQAQVGHRDGWYEIRRRRGRESVLHVRLAGDAVAAGCCIRSKL